MKRDFGPGMFVTFALGLGVGAVAALLLAPKEGQACATRWQKVL